MLKYKVGSAGTSATAKGMARYLLSQTVLSSAVGVSLAAGYYSQGAIQSAAAGQPSQTLYKSQRQTDLAEVNAVLHANIEALAVTLLGQPNKAMSSRNQLRWGSKGAFSVEIAGPKKGQWYDHSASEGGHPLNLIRAVRGGTWREIIDWAYAWSGLDPNRPVPVSVQPATKVQQAEADKEMEADQQRRIRIAKQLAAESVPVAGTLAERYLVRERNIIRPREAWPESVRYHEVTPAVARRLKIEPSKSLLVTSTTLDGDVRMVQRVFLTDQARKDTAVSIVKRSNGVFEGSLVRFPGHTPDGPVVLAEGIETGLSAWRATGNETWVAVGGFGRIDHLPAGREYIVARDDDAPGSPEDLNLSRTIERWVEAGADLKLATPWQIPRGNKTDLNDVLKEQGIDAVGLRIVLAQQVEKKSTGRFLRSDTHPALCRALGVSPREDLSEEKITNLMNAWRADGEKVEGKTYAVERPDSMPIGWVDMCWNPDKTVSVAWAFAPTDNERQIILDAHREAVEGSMAYAETIISQIRSGHAGDGGTERGHITWINFEHPSARPTLELAKENKDGTKETLFGEVPVSGDPHLHTHSVVPNVAMTSAGKIRAFWLDPLEGRVHEMGAYYHALLSTALRRHGIDVHLDQQTGSARVSAVAEWVRQAFSKRSRMAAALAERWATEQGVSWDTLSADEKSELLQRACDKTKLAKDSVNADFATWQAEAERLGWKHASVLRPGEEWRPSQSEDEWLDQAYQAALPFLDKAFQKSAVISDAEIRIAACHGMVVAGVREGYRDIDKITRAFLQRGVLQNGEHTDLIWAPDTANRKRRAVLTTALHESQEEELIACAQAAAKDLSGKLSPAVLAEQIAASGLDFTTKGGSEQLAAMTKIAAGGRLSVTIGAAGVGKSAMLKPLVGAWHHEGRTVIGVALAWRQTEDMAGAGIFQRHAMQNFLALYDEDKRKAAEPLDQNTVVVVDELGQVGTRQLLQLLRLQRERGFSLVMMGDDRQCRAIEAGPVIDLLRRALGKDQIPELMTVIRQRTERERLVSSLFREGSAEQALLMKREDGTAIKVAGSYDDVVFAIARKWRELTEANADNPSYSLSVMAPTNADARAISAAIREQRRAMGQIAAEEITRKAVDQHGEQYDLKLSVGDKVRLFKRLHVKGRVLGNNGSVLTIEAVDRRSITLRNDKTDRQEEVQWSDLSDEETGPRIRLSYGDVLTIDAGQGITSAEHINAMPSGSAKVNSFKVYVSESRHRERSWMIVSDGAERKEISGGRRELNDFRPISEEDVWANIARNLERSPVKESAIEMIARVREVNRVAVKLAQTALSSTPGRAWKNAKALKLALRVGQTVAQTTQSLLHREKHTIKQ